MNVLRLTRSRVETVLALAVATSAVSIAGCRSAQTPIANATQSRAYVTAQPATVPEMTSEQARDIEFAMARTLEQQGNLEAAEAAYRALHQKMIDRGAVEHRLAVVCDRQGRPHEADSHFKAALKGNSKDPELLTDFGYSLYRQGRHQEAEQRFREAIACQPGHRRAHNHLGLVLVQSSRRDEGLAEFRKAGCSEAEAHMNVAIGLTMSDRFEEAREEYELATSLGLPTAKKSEQAYQLDRLLADAGVQRSSSATRTTRRPPATPDFIQAGHARVVAE